MITFLKNTALGALLMLLIAVAPIHQAQAQWVLQAGEMDQQIHRGISLIYNMQFGLADKTFDSVITAHPDHPAGYFYHAMVTFWRAITNPDNTTYDEQYRQWLQQAIDKSDKMLAVNEKDVTGIFYKGAALGMRARIFAIRPTWSDAIDLILGDAKEGVKYLDEIEAIIPSNPDVLFGRGMYNYYVEAVKEDYPAIAPVIGLFASGNKKVGLAMLEIAAKDAVYAKTEAQYELLKLYYSYEKNYVRAKAFAEYLTNKYPNNEIFLHYLGFSQVTAGLTAGFDSTYHVILARAQAKQEGYTIRQAREAMYFLGLAQMQYSHGNMDSALYYFYNSDLLSRKILPPDKLDWYVTRAELYMGEAYDIKGDRPHALEMYRRVLELTDASGAHADATKFLTRPYTH